MRAPWFRHNWLLDSVGLLNVLHGIIPILSILELLHVLLIRRIPCKWLRSNALEIRLLLISVCSLLQAASPFQLLLWILGELLFLLLLLRFYPLLPGYVLPCASVAVHCIRSSALCFLGLSRLWLVQCLSAQDEQLLFLLRSGRRYVLIGSYSSLAVLALRLRCRSPWRAEVLIRSLSGWLLGWHLRLCDHSPWWTQVII
mmetsp:Transcript_44522/g.102797  ORF Transcript_44522/g.102797 Transcript_44522/m.102797 type:complete len:200 (+) Transcript_44522:219-818(+)